MVQKMKKDSQYVKELLDLGFDLKVNGWDRWSSIVMEAARRMRGMEELIIELSARDWEKEKEGPPGADYDKTRGPFK